MSRIGRKPINIPNGVNVSFVDGVFYAKGPKGELSQSVNSNIFVDINGSVITVSRKNDEKSNRALHGLTRSLIFNMIEGVTNGFSKTLEINGVGYKVQKQAKNLVLSLGFSHKVVVSESDDITFEVQGSNKIIVHGIDKQKVGQFAANIRSKRPPEPYKGKGIKYDDEVIRRKEGKAGKTTKK